MNIKSAAIALPLITMGTLASAQNVEYLSYGASIGTGSGNTDLFALGGTIDYRNSDFVLNGNLSYSDLGDSDDVTNLNFRAGYFVTPEAVLYAGFGYLEEDNDDAATYNIGGEYGFSQFTVGLNYADTDESGVDSSATIYAGYQATNELELGLIVSDQDSDTTTALTADYDLGDTELFAIYLDDDDTEIFAFNGNYDFGNGFRAGGGYADLDDGDELYSISGGYEVAESLWIDLSIGRFEESGGSDADIIGLGISFETGRETLLIDRLETVATQSVSLPGFSF